MQTTKLAKKEKQTDEHTAAQTHALTHTYTPATYTCLKDNEDRLISGRIENTRVKTHCEISNTKNVRRNS